MSDARPPYRAKFHFEQPPMRGKRLVAGWPRRLSCQRWTSNSALLDELCLSGSWERYMGTALARSLILNGPGARLLATLDPRRAEEAYRLAHDLAMRREYAAWRARQNLLTRPCNGSSSRRRSAGGCSGWQSIRSRRYRTTCARRANCRRCRPGRREVEGSPRVLADFGLDDAALFKCISKNSSVSTCLSVSISRSPGGFGESSLPFAEPSWRNSTYGGKTVPRSWPIRGRPGNTCGLVLSSYGTRFKMPSRKGNATASSDFGRRHELGPWA